MKTLPIGQLFALPLQSAVRAQGQTLLETLAVIEQIGLDKERARTFRFRVDQSVEERVVDPTTGVSEIRYRPQQLEVSIPVLALVAPPGIHLHEMQVEFGVDVIEPMAEAITSQIASAAGGQSLAASPARFATPGQGNGPMMKVTMKIVQETPEGVGRLQDLLADLLNGRISSES